MATATWPKHSSARPLIACILGSVLNNNWNNKPHIVWKKMQIVEGEKDLS